MSSIVQMGIRSCPVEIPRWNIAGKRIINTHTQRERGFSAAGYGQE